MANYQEIVKTLTQGLANQYRNLKDLEAELQGFESQYADDYKIVNDRINDINVQIDRTIKDMIKAIPVPKDGQNGKDAEVDYTQIEDFISKLISELPKAKDGKDGIDGKDGADGRDGLDGVNGQDGINGEDGEKGERGATGERGEKGDKGEDGLSIEDIYEKNGYIVIILSDGTKKELKLPSIEKHLTTVRAGANDTTEIIKTTTSLNLTPKSQTILCDATAGEITIKLPEPLICINSQRSYKIAITKIDLTANKVNIVPFGSEKIVNDVSQYLVASEIINLITDGTNWYYGS